MPEDHARGLVLEVEEVELAAEATVVALFGFLKHRQIGLEVVLRGPCGAVDALEHLVLGVAAPVGAGNLHQTVHLEGARGRHMGAAAEVGEVALTVERDRFTLRDGFNEFGLVLFAEIREELHGFVAGHLDAFDLDVALDDLVHALLDGLEVLGGERTAVGEVVVEAVFNGRPDRDLGFRVKLLHGLRHQMGGRVTDDFNTFGVAARDDGDLSVLVDHMGEVDELAVDAAGESSLGQTGTDVGGDIGNGDGGGEFALGAVRKGNCNHF